MLVCPQFLKKSLINLMTPSDPSFDPQSSSSSSSSSLNISSSSSRHVGYQIQWLLILRNARQITTVRGYCTPVLVLLPFFFSLYFPCSFFLSSIVLFFWLPVYSYLDFPCFPVSRMMVIWLPECCPEWRKIWSQHLYVGRLVLGQGSLCSFFNATAAVFPI